MRKGLQPLRSGTCLVHWMALITLSVLANALSATCASAGTFKLKGQKLITNCDCLTKLQFQLIFPVKQRARGWMLVLVKLKTLLCINQPPRPNSPHPPALQTLTLSSLLLSPDVRKVHSSREVNWISKDDGHTVWADLFTSWLMGATEGPQWDSGEMASKPKLRRLW